MRKNIQIFLMMICAASFLTGCSTKKVNVEDNNTVVEANAKDKDDTKKNNKKKVKKNKDGSVVEYGPDNFDAGKLSDNVIIAVESDPSWGDYYDCLGSTIKITGDREAIYYIGSVEAGRVQLETSVYNELIEKLNFKEVATVGIYHPDPQTICDGGSNYIILYDKNGNEYVRRGGYCVEGEKFWEYYKLVSNVVDREWKNECLNAAIEKMENIKKENEIFLETAIPDIDYKEMLVSKLTGESYGCGLIVSVSVPVIIDEEQVSIIITDDNGKKYDVIMYYGGTKKSIFEHYINETEENRKIATEPITYEMLVEMSAN